MQKKGVSVPAGVDEETTHGGRGARRIGLWGGVSTIVSLMIGSGIFTYAGKIHKQMQSTSLALLVWVLAGVLGLTGALCYAELGTMIPGSGGEAQYLAHGMGPLMTYLFDWTSILILKPGTVAIMAAAFSDHMVDVINLLTGAGLGASARVYGTFVGCILVTMLSLFPRVSDRILKGLTFSKIAALVFIIFGGLWYGQFTPEGQAALTSNFKDHLRPSSAALPLTFSDFIGALCEGLWGFEGWNNLNIVAGDVVRPERNLPLAIWISVAGVLCLYVMTLLGYYCILPHDTFSGLRTAGVTVGERVFSAILGPDWAPIGGSLMGLFVIGSTFSAALSSMSTSSEIITLSARSGRIPRYFRTNTRAYWMQGALSVILTFFLHEEMVHWMFGKKDDELVIVYTFPTWIFYALCTVVLLSYRWWKPALERPYRVTLVAPVLFMLACVVLIASTFLSSMKHVAASLVIMLAGIPFYYFLVASKSANAK